MPDTATISPIADPVGKVSIFPDNCEDSDLVTVLHGYGRVEPNKHNTIDGIDFIGGVARDVPYGVAKHWRKGTRADGKPSYGRVQITIAPNTANEAEFMRLTGMAHMPNRELTAQMAARDVDEIAAILGQDRIAQIAAWHAAHKTANTRR